jgi:hypothetical protein
MSDVNVEKNMNFISELRRIEAVINKNRAIFMSAVWCKQWPVN